MQTQEKRKTKCSHEGCQNKVVKIIGDWYSRTNLSRYCLSKFCSPHRLPESHQCPNLEHCRQDSFNKNAGKLRNEKCVATKV